MSEEPTGTKSKPANIRWLYVLGMIAAGIVVLGFTLPIFSNPAKVGPKTRELSNLKQLMVAFKMYSEDEGHPPKTLSELWATEKYLGADGGRVIGKYRRPKTETQLDWLYFPERIPENENDEPTMVLASPEPYDGDRIIGWSDTKCQFVSEAAFAVIQSHGGKRATRK